MTRMKELKVPHDELRTPPREDTHFPLYLFDSKATELLSIQGNGKESEDVGLFDDG